MLTVCLARDNGMQCFGDWRDTAYRAELVPQTEGMTPQTEGMTPQTEGMTSTCSKMTGFRLSQLNFDSYIILENNKKHM